MTASVQDAFMDAFHTGCVVAFGVCWLGAMAAVALPGRRTAIDPAHCGARHGRFWLHRPEQ